MSSRQHFKIPIPMKLAFLPIRLLNGLGNVEQSMKLIKWLGDKAPQNHFEQYAFTKSDVVVATLARSGTHWMMQIILQIAHRGQAEYDYLYDIVAWPEYFPEATLPLNATPPTSPTGYRVIKTHDIVDNVPINDLAHYITVIRDPKEFLVSTYHFAPQALVFLDYTQVEPEQWLQLFMTDYFPFGSWADHTAGWWALRDKPNTIVIPFNHLKADMNGYIDRISTFLNVELNNEERDLVIEKSSFDYMKNINHKFSPIPDNKPVTDVIREGRTKSGKDLFTPEQLAMIDRHCKDELQRLGSDFPYDEIFG